MGRIMRRETYKVPFRYLKRQGDRYGQCPLVLALLLALLLLPGIANADAFVGGIPLTTVQTGTVTGDVFIDATPPTWANQGVSDIVKTFTLPQNAVGNVTWARLYISAYAGHMQNDYKFYVLNRWDGNGDGVYSDASPDFIVNETGHAGFVYTGNNLCNDNSAFSALGGTSCDPYKMINDHENRVTSDYFMWYDVTDKIRNQTVSVNVKTKGSFDGRTKVATLVVAYNNATSATKTTYWVNQGHDVCSYYTEQMSGHVAVGTTTFGTAGTGTISSAVLTVDYMASHNGVYGFPAGDSYDEDVPDDYSVTYDENGFPVITGDPPTISFSNEQLASGYDVQGAYSGVMHWDVTSVVNAFPDTNAVLGYSRDVTQSGTSAFYKIPLTILVVKSPLPPAANFTANVTTGMTPLAVLFTDTSTASPVSWTWDFGDGNTTNATVQNPVHQYAKAGKYTVKLTATNTVGTNTTTKTDYIAVTSTMPATNFTATPVTGTAPLMVTFTDTSTASPVSWTWDFGDNDSTNATVQNPVHTYSSAGTYTVNLTVKNAEGSSNTTSKAGYVTASTGSASPVAAFIAAPLTGPAPLVVTFADKSTGNPTGWAWDFNNDGIVDSTVENPTYTYTAAASYTVSLTVTGSGGTNSTVKTGYITVSSGTSGTPVLSLSPQTRSIGVGESRDYQIVLDSAPDGLAGYDLVVSLATPGVAEITHVGYPPWANMNTPALTPNQSVLMSAADGNKQEEAGVTGIVLATLTVKGDADGKTAIVISSVNIDTDKEGDNNLTPVVYNGSAVVGTYTGLVANFSANVTSGIAPLSVQFADTSTGSPTSWFWVFSSDGMINSTDQNPVVTYKTTGTYPVSLTVTKNAESDSITRTGYISVMVGSSLKAPVAAFTANVTSGAVPLTVAFVDSSSNAPSSWTWDFNNDGTADSTDENPVYTYTAAGTYTINLTATNSGGSGTASKTVTVLPVASFTATPTYGTVPLTVTFVDTSTAGTRSLRNWKWSYGDGNTSTSKSPTFTYTVPGVYTANLIVSADGSHWSDAATQTLTVNTESGFPGISFSASQTSGTVPLTVQFTDASSNTPYEWSWDFGDGSTSTDQNPIHKYTTHGTYSVTLTAKNAKGSATSTRSSYISALSSSAADCDLSIDGNIMSVGGAVFAHEGNDVYIYTIKNSGSQTCKETTVRLAASDGFSGTASVPSLAAGTNTTVFVTDPTVRNEGKTVTYTATVDPSNTVEETSENNNVKTSSGFTAIWNGYKGKRYMDGGSDVKTQHYYDLYGNIVYHLGNSVYTSGSANGGTWSDLTWAWTASQPSVPDTATVKAAYLYVPYTWDNSNAAESATLTFNGATVSHIASYKDWSNFGSYPNYKYGLMVYDVTSGYVKNGANTATFHRTDGWAKISMYEFYLVVVYEDSTKSRKQIFMNEEFDLLGASTAMYGTDESEATAYAPFTGLTVDTSGMQKATLVTFVPSGNGPEGNLIFNGNTVGTKIWDYGGSGTGDNGMPEIAVDSRDVTSYVTASNNVAEVQSTLDSGTPCMALSQAFLIVDYGTLSGVPGVDFTASPTSGTVSLSVTFTDESSNSPTSWSWNFGDGSTSTSQNPTHTYSSVGTYSVTLTAKNDKGSATTTKSSYITVTSASTVTTVTTSSSTHLDSSQGGSGSSGTSGTSGGSGDSSDSTTTQSSASSAAIGRSQAGPLEKAGSGGSSSGNGGAGTDSDLPSWLIEIVLGALVVLGAGGAVAHVKGYSLGLIAGTIVTGAASWRKGLVPPGVPQGAASWDSPNHAGRTIEVETGLVRSGKTSRFALPRWWPVAAIIAIIVIALAAAAGLGLLGGIALPLGDAGSGGSFDVIPTVESIKDLDLTNHVPDYPAGFSAHNGILFVYNGNEKIPLDELEVDLTKGAADVKITATTRPPSPNAVGTGLSSYFEEEGNGDGTLESGEWLMVYADSCYDASKSDSEPKTKVVGWHPAGTGSGVEVPMNDTINYVLKDTATGTILQEGTLDFVPVT